MERTNWRVLRVRARITFPVWVLRHLSDKARELRILLGMERTSHAPDGVEYAQTGEIILA